MLPHMANAKCKEERGEGLVLRGGNTVHELLGRPFGEAFQGEQLHRRQLVQVRHIGDQLRVEERPHPLVAESPDVHRAAAREVNDRFEDTRRARDVGAVRHHLVLRVLDLRAAAGAALRHLVRLLRTGALVLDGPEDLRDHLARASHLDPVALTNVLGRDQLGVVQGGVRDGDAADLHRLEHGVRIERAGAAHVDPDLEQLRDLHFGRELARHRPARLTIPDRAQLGVERSLVDFDGDTVGSVVERR